MAYFMGGGNAGLKAPAVEQDLFGGCSAVVAAKRKEG